MFNIEYLQTNMRCLCFEKNPTNTLVLVHRSIVVHVPWHTSETMSSSVSRQKSLIYDLDVG